MRLFTFYGTEPGPNRQKKTYAVVAFDEQEARELLPPGFLVEEESESGEDLNTPNHRARIIGATAGRVTI